MTQMLAQREHDYFAETVICANCYIVAEQNLYVLNKKSSAAMKLRSLSKMADTYSPANAVPSARAGLTSLFGMGRGGTPLPNRLNLWVLTM